MHPLDRPLLLGLVALEHELVSSAELIDAFRAWRKQPDESLGQILAARGKLSAERIQSLEQYLAESSLIPDSAQSSSLAAPTTTLRPESTPKLAGAEPTTPSTSGRRASSSRCRRGDRRRRADTRYAGVGSKRSFSTLRGTRVG